MDILFTGEGVTFCHLILLFSCSKDNWHFHPICEKSTHKKENVGLGSSSVLTRGNIFVTGIVLLSPGTVSDVNIAVITNCV